MAGTPRLHTALRHDDAFRHIGELLEHPLDLHILGSLLEHGLLEIGEEFFLDDEHGLLKTCPPGVKQGKVDDLFPTGPHRVNLLQSTITAAHAGSHNNQYGFAHNDPPFLCFKKMVVVILPLCNKEIPLHR